MRKVIASTFVTVDGYVVGPNEDMSWVMNNFNEEMAKYAGDLMNSMDTILLASHARRSHAGGHQLRHRALICSWQTPLGDVIQGRKRASQGIEVCNNFEEEEWAILGMNKL
jgi:hypothetical protein